MSISLVLPVLTQFELIPSAPFAFDATFFKPDHFPTPDHVWQPGVRWQTMRWGEKMLGLKFEQRGSVDAPVLGVSVWSSAALTQAQQADLARELTYRYNLDLDLSAFYQRFQADAHVAPLLTQFRGMRLMNPGSLYEYLMIAIVLQNATVRRTVAMMRTLMETYGTLLEFDGQTLFAFWLPEELAVVSEADLRTLKVGYRAKSFLRVSQAFAKGEIDEMALRSQPKETQRKALLGLYGVGPASVWYLLVDVFHHLDELNTISPWEQKIYSRLFFGTDPESPLGVETLREHILSHFSPYPMMAVHYVWEGLFWERRNGGAEWLAPLIRL